MCSLIEHIEREIRAKEADKGKVRVAVTMERVDADGTVVAHKKFGIQLDPGDLKPNQAAGLAAEVIARELPAFAEPETADVEQTTKEG